MRYLIFLPTYLLVSQGHLVVSSRLFDDHNDLTSLEPRYDSIDSLVSLDSVNHGECQVGIASRLQLQCGATNPKEERMSEKERRSIAISFTLCSMISASQPIPTECTYWAPGADSRGWTTEMERHLSPCIAALRRSTQDWTSYEGYLNKASQLCLALEGRMQADTARKAYIDLTSHSIQVFQDLQDQLEKGKMDNQETQNSVQTVITDLQRAMMDTFSTVSILVSHGERQDEAISSFEAAVKLFSQQGTEVWKKSTEEGQEMLRNMMTRAEEHHKVERAAASEQMSMVLADLAQKHAGTVGDQLRSMTDYIGAVMQKAQDDSHAVSLAEIGRLDATNAAWSAFVTQLNSMGSEVNELTSSVSELLPAVEDSLNDAAQLKVLHSSMASSISSVQTASNRLRDELSSSLVAVNETLATISSWRQGLALRSWWRPQGVSLFAGSSLMSMDQLQRINGSKLLRPLFQVVLTLVVFLANLLISTFWLGVSAITFIWIVTAKRFRFLLGWTRLVQLFGPKLRDEEEIIDRRSVPTRPRRSRAGTRSPPAYTAHLGEDTTDSDATPNLANSLRPAKAEVPPISARSRASSRLYPELPAQLEPIGDVDEVEQLQQREQKPYGKLRRSVRIDAKRSRRAASAPL